MKAFSVAGIAAGLLALVLALAALVGMPEAAQVTREDLARVGDEAKALQVRIKALEEKLDALDKRLSGELGARIGETGRTLSDLKREVSRLDKALAEGTRPAAGPEPAQAGALDEARVREIVRQELQAAGPGRRGPMDPGQALRDRLGLDAEKAERVSAILARMGQEMGQIWRDNRGGDRDENRRLMREVQAKAEAELAKVLSPEEMEKYRQMQEEFERRFGGPPRGRGRDRGGEAPAGAPQNAAPAEERF